MNRLLKILLFCLVAHTGFAQCDTTGILLELQATTNLQGLLMGDNKCLVVPVILAPLYLSNDTLSIDTTGLGGGGGGSATDLTFTGSGPYTLNSSTGTDVTITQGAGMTLTRTSNDLSFAAIDQSATNEAWTIDADDADTEVISNQTVKFQGGGILVTDYIPGTDILSLVATEVDGSITNELQTIANTSNATSHTATLSNSGGSVQLVEGTGITLTTTGTTLDGILTIAATESQTANNGLSDNEAGGGIFRLGNRYMNGSDGLFSFDRKVNLNAFRLFVGDNTDSTLLMVDGTNDKVGIHTTSASRTLHVNGEVRITDLVTDNPTLLVGADGDGDLNEVTLGTGLSYTGSTLNVTAGTNYQLLRDDGTDKTVRPAANFVSSTRISQVLTDDAGNGETEIVSDLVLASVADAYLSNRGALTVMGRAANSTGVVADIVSTADGQVLRRNGTTLDWGTVVTAGITDDAVTYAKLQNAAADQVILGNNNGAGTNFEELTVANVYTMLGLTGVANRFALWTGTNTLASDAAFTFDGANDRATFTGTVAGIGANSAFLNLNSGAIAGATTFLRMSGNITNNLIMEMANANNAAATSNTIATISTGGAVGGDPILQFNISGQVTTSLGLDNSDVDKFKITPSSATPGGVANASFVGTKDAIPLWGFNIDAPARTVDVAGGARAVNLINTAVNPTSSNLGTGLGTGGVVNSITGGNNGFRVIFTTGTAPAADGDLFRITIANGFTASAAWVWQASSVTALNEQSKFLKNGTSPGFVNMKANGTLTANTQYILDFVLVGQ